MIKSMFRILTIPIVYCFLLILFLIKWLIVAPILFCLYIIKYILVGAIIGVIVGYFFGPTATLVVIGLCVLGSISAVASDISDSFWGNWYINWSYAIDVFDSNKNDKMIRNRKRYIKMANKKYRAAKDEFDGFDRMADISAR